MAQLQERHQFELDEVLAALRARSESDPADLLRRAVKVIARVEQLDEERVGHREAQLLAERFALRVVDLLTHLERAGRATVTERDGMLGLDAIFAEYLSAEFGPVGDLAANGLAEPARAAWREYNGRPGLFASNVLFERWKETTAASCVEKFSEVVWKVDVQPDRAALDPVAHRPDPESTEQASPPLGASPQQEKVPAVAHVVLSAINVAFWQPGRRLQRSADGAVVLDRRGTPIASIRTEGLSQQRGDALLDAFRVTESLPAHRLFRWLIARVTEQGSSAEPRKVTISGGLAALAQALGTKGEKLTAILKSTLDLFERIDLPLPDGKRPLLTWTATPPSRGNKVKLVITLDHAVTPAYVALMGKSLPQRDAKRLVPVPSRLPPLVGHQSTHGAQAALQMLLMTEIRAQAELVSTSGYAIVSSDQWEDFFARAGMPLRMIEEVLVRWISSESSTGFLWREDEDPANAVRLAEPFDASLDLIERSGQRVHRGRAMRKRSIKSRLG